MKRSVITKSWFTFLLVIFTIIMFHVLQSIQKRNEVKSSVDAVGTKHVLAG